ncbi:hypothetical protein ACXR8U_21865 [Methylobacterium radiotolerans]|jgi:hypothetical protein|uniref:hypothetical protein n=1 Tax=Methylobacterium radiotolerans TaxID=31998 RepID=UPI0005E2BC1F|nr:hypothetical protein [Methylobacterium radiotolerans]GAN50950.1 hypothetical protein ME121_5009 [Methylobacterium sp. ME121]
MTTTQNTTNKKPKRAKAKSRISLKEFIPNYRDFQKEAARLEEMLGPQSNLDVASNLPAGMTREWAVDAWEVVKANADLDFRPLKPGTEFPSGVYADRAKLAMLRIRHSPFDHRLQMLAIRQMLDADEMKYKAAQKRLKAEKRAAKAEASQN